MLSPSLLTPAGGPGFPGAKKDTPPGALPPRSSSSLSSPRAYVSLRVLPAGLAHPQGPVGGRAHAGGSWLLRSCPVNSSAMRRCPRRLQPRSPFGRSWKLAKDE